MSTAVLMDSNGVGGMLLSLYVGKNAEKCNGTSGPRLFIIQLHIFLIDLGSSFFVGLSVYYLGKAYGFGSSELPAPQATLMKTVLDGVLDGNLQWGLVGIGAAFSILVFLLKIPLLQGIKKGNI